MTTKCYDDNLANSMVTKKLLWGSRLDSSQVSCSSSYNKDEGPCKTLSCKWYLFNKKNC